MSTEIGAFGEVLTEETVGVLVGATLPWCLRVAEVDVEVGIFAELGMLRHLGALVPRQRPAELVGQSRDRHSDLFTHGLGAMAGESGPLWTRFCCRGLA